MTIKITSPAKGLNLTTEIGPQTFKFVDGIAEVEELSDATRAWLKKRGYGIDGPATQEKADQPEPPDPRDVGTEKVGTPTRDGAVDPRDGDFLAPTNAGDENPHGSKVVSPEVHASEGVKPVAPGDVHVDDPAAQEAKEKAATEAPSSVDEESTKAQLLAYAEANGIEVKKSAKNAELLESIRAAEQGPGPDASTAGEQPGDGEGDGDKTPDPDGPEAK